MTYLEMLTEAGTEYGGRFRYIKEWEIMIGGCVGWWLV